MSCSENMVSVFGYHPPSIIGSKLEKFCFGKDRDHLSKLLDSTFLSNKENEIEFRLILSDRSLRIVSAPILALSTDNEDCLLATSRCV